MAWISWKKKLSAADTLLRCPTPNARRSPYLPKVEQLESRLLFATRIWSGAAAANSNWSNASNWQGLVAPTTDDDLVFPNGAGRLSNTNDFASGTRFRSITFSGPDIAGYQLKGNAIVLTNGIVENETRDSSSPISFEDRIELAQITLGASQTFTALTPFYGTLSVYTPINLNGFSLTLDTGTTGFSRAYLGDAVSGNGAIVKIGTGWWFQFGHNTYRGPTTIRQGALVIETNDALGSLAEGTTVENGATLVVQFVPVTTPEPLTLFGTGGGSGAINVYADDTEFTGALTLGSSSLIHATSLFDKSKTKLSGTVITNGFDLSLDGELDTTVLGSITGSGRVIVSTNQILNGTGTVNGSIILNQGILSPGLGGAGVLTSGGVTLSPGTSFQVNLNGAAAGAFSQLQSTGTVFLNNSTLAVNPSAGYTPNPADFFVILFTTNSSSLVVGQFASLPEGAKVNIKGQDFTIHYVNPSDGRLEASSQVILLGPTATAPPSGRGSNFRPLTPGQNIFVTAADRGGGPDVKVFDAATGQVWFNFFAYDQRFTGGVRVAAGDVNRDGVMDIVTAAGPGGGPNVTVFDGSTGSWVPGPLGSFFAYDQAFTGGVYVACGDVNGDGFADVICGADAGGGPNVTVFNGQDGARLTSFFAYDSGFTGGVRVSAGDVNGDGYADIICGAGPGGGPNVTVFSGQDLAQTRLLSFFAYDPGFSAGIFIATGDVDGDRKADIISGAGPGGGPNVAVFRGYDSVQLLAFFPYDMGFSGGVRVASVDRDRDGKADVTSVAGPGGGPDVAMFNGLDGRRLDQFFAYDPNFSGGLYVAGTGR